MKKKYVLTDEHRAELPAWRDRWISNAMSTKPMDEEEMEICRKAVIGLYEAAGKKAPPLERIVFVPSPMVLRFAGGFASAIWHMRKTGFKPANATNAAANDATNAVTNDAARAATNDATSAATDAATYAATNDATRSATYDAAYAATNDATNDATYAATRAATEAATNAAAYAATIDATYDATYAATNAAASAATIDATNAATRLIPLARSWFQFDLPAVVKVSVEFNLGKLGIMCAERAYNLWQGGNQWSAWASYLTFFRHIAKLEIDYSKFDHWEQLALHSGPRIMHEEFCMISDRPTKLLVDSENRPHCDTGPFCEWSDGTKLYSIHGMRVPAELVETPADKLDAREWLKEENTDWRRIAFQKIGINKVVEQLGAEVVDAFECPVGGKYELLMLDIGLDSKRPFLKMRSPSIDAHHIEGVRPGITTVKEALAFRNGTKTYIQPGALT